MARILTTYIAVLFFVSLGFIGVGAIGSVAGAGETSEPTVQTAPTLHPSR